MSAGETPQPILRDVSDIISLSPPSSLATLRLNLILVLIFLLLDLSLFFLMIGEFSGSLTIHKLGGGIGIAAAVAAFYTGAAQVLTEDVSWFTLPVGPISRRLD